VAPLVRHSETIRLLVLFTVDGHPMILPMTANTVGGFIFTPALFDTPAVATG
jgi:hypothetical protein